MVDEEMVGMLDNYLRGAWYEYRCKDKKEIRRIIIEELEKRPNYMDMNIAKLCLIIKRRCMSEL